MIGSPFYYDVLFDDGPGDVVFHDCMWSGICTCCIQLLHQDSYQFANDSPDLKMENSHCRTQINNHNAVATITSTTTSASSLQSQLHQHHQPQLISAASCRIAPENPAPISQTGPNSNISSPDALTAAVVASANNCRTCPDDSSSSSSIAATSAAAAAAASRTASCLTSPDTLSSSSASSSTSSSSSSSPAPAQHHGNSSSSLSPTCNSQSASPKPIRRREHNDSERKRRDHLRNAFNFLRDQVPRFKTISKKPPRIQILHEATKYVQIVMKEAEELERRLAEERTKHELNMKLSMK